MTIEELIKKLQEFPPEMKVYVQTKESYECFEEAKEVRETLEIQESENSKWYSGYESKLVKVLCITV